MLPPCPPVGGHGQSGGAKPSPDLTGATGAAGAVPEEGGTGATSGAGGAGATVTLLIDVGSGWGAPARWRRW